MFERKREQDVYQWPQEGHLPHLQAARQEGCGKSAGHEAVSITPKGKVSTRAGGLRTICKRDRGRRGFSCSWTISSRAHGEQLSGAEGGDGVRTRDGQSHGEPRGLSPGSGPSNRDRSRPRSDGLEAGVRWRASCKHRGQGFLPRTGRVLKIQLDSC